MAEAARHDRYTVVRALIDRGLDLNAAYKESCMRSDGTMSEEPDYYTNPLRESVAWGNYKTAQLLLKNGADANARTYEWGKTPLFDAVGSPRGGVNASPIDAVKRIAITRLLLDHGGDINIKSNRNESLLYAAACEGHAEILEFLLEAGAYNLLKNTTQTDGFTPLMATSCAKHGVVTRMLLEKGVDCNRHAAKDLDALALAVELDYSMIDSTPTIEALLEFEADVNSDGQSISPLS